MVDDHVMVLQGVKALLGTLAPELLVDTTDTLAGALAQVAQRDFDVVLLDWDLGDALSDGVRAMAQLREGGCEARIVVLSGSTDPDVIHRAIEFGASGFVPKRHSSEAMLEALQTVLAGGVYLPKEALRRAEALGEAGDPHVPNPRERLLALTARQKDVYRAAARGLSNKQVGLALGIAEATVKSHLKAVYHALGVRNRTEAAYPASREGIRID